MVLSCYNSNNIYYMRLCIISMSVSVHVLEVYIIKTRAGLGWLVGRLILNGRMQSMALHYI